MQKKKKEKTTSFKKSNIYDQVAYSVLLLWEMCILSYYYYYYHTIMWCVYTYNHNIYEKEILPCSSDPEMQYSPYASSVHTWEI